MADNFMMNCISPDYKNTFFYKYSNSERYLFIRPMKNKWKNFCEVNFKDEKNISCNFDNLNIIRSSIVENGNIYIEKNLNINFSEYSLIEKIKVFNNNNLTKETNLIYKCRKIKI
tara:strand:+ start:11844 stop:12188 length:345 start_codon:yes stop_codon:yes gene_type:complete